MNKRDLCSFHKNVGQGSISQRLAQNKLFSSLCWRNAFCCGDACVAQFASSGTQQHLKPEREKPEINLETSVPVFTLPVFSWRESDHAELIISFSVKTGKPRGSSHEEKPPKPTRYKVSVGSSFALNWYPVEVRASFLHPSGLTKSIPVQTSLDRDGLAGRCRAGCFPLPLV